ncbi:MAG: glycosyltransferase family 4 protein [Actinobacteria bacterium]|nr:glycosyltransferase family 4 protein [Actinomycetota bacterium]
MKMYHTVMHRRVEASDDPARALAQAADGPRAVPRHSLPSKPEPFQPRRLTRLRHGRRTLVVNGRFRQRAVTGVERYATELVARLPEGVPLLGPDKRLAHPPLGHVWEQTGLPLEVGRDQVLWSPCNTGPARMRNHVVTIHDLSPIEHPEWFASNYGHWMRSLTRSLVKHSEHILVPSQFTRQRLIEVCGVRDDKITVVPNGVNPSFRDGRSGLTEEQRVRLGVPEGRYVLVLATVEPRKNLERVIEAFELVQRDHPDLSLVLAGSKGRASVFAHGDEAERLAGCEPVRLGYVADELIPRLYASASAFVYAPLYEGFGIPPLEAAAAGAPSVLSDIPPLRELGLTAAWVDPTDVDSVAAGIACQLNQPEHDEHSADTVIKAFSWDASAQLLVETLVGLGIGID